MISLANALEPSSRAAAASAEAAHARRGERVGEPRDERRLGPDDDEVDAASRAARRAPSGRPAPTSSGARRAGCPRCPARTDLRALRRAQQRADERVLAPAGADDEDLSQRRR